LSYIPDYTHPYLQISTAAYLVPNSLVSGLMSLYKVTLGRYLRKRLFQPSSMLWHLIVYAVLEKTIDLKIYIGREGRGWWTDNNKGVTNTSCKENVRLALETTL